MKKNSFAWYMLMVVSLSFIQINSSYAQLAKCKGKYFGNIIPNSVPSSYNSYWNQATSENGSKWGSVEGTQGVYNFSTSDVAYIWAKNNNGLFKYHNLIWGSQTPGWVGSASTAAITAAIEPYFSAVQSHYASMGGIKIMDVLNEPINTALPGNLKAALTAGYKAEPANAGDLNNPYGWAIWVFQLARKYFPNTTLLVNEYNIEMNWNNCRTPYIALVNAVKNAPNLTNGQKNLIDGVGLQCHGVDNLTAANFQACIDQIWSQTGVPVHITEFDQAANPNEAKQQSVYSTLIPVAWQHPHVAGITLWGYIQGTTWINGNGVAGAGGTDSGILYANGTERPALTWLKQYLASQTSLSCCPAPAPFAACTGTTNIPPTVSITSPINNATYTSPAAITINATAADADGSVTSVQFFNGTTLLGTDLTSPYTFAWTNVAAGTYSIIAKATDNSNAVTTSTAVTVVVSVPNTPPTVSITSPLANATFTAPASITINATAADANGTVTNVQFYSGTTLLGSDATAPYSFNWTGVAAGTYTLIAKATDNAGAVTTSTAVDITVTAPINQLPTVSITSPSNNASFTALATVTISATAADADGTVTGVQFFNGTTLLGSDATTPYSFVWTNAAAGTYSITAKATDNSGGVTTSTIITITVNPPIINIAPTVSITAPTSLATFTAPGSVPIAAIAADTDGTVVQVQFYNGTTLLGTDATAPYSFVWTNVAAGTYSITAKATDNGGATTTSIPVSITVVPAPNKAPTVSITAPANNATFVAPASVTISATAADVDGTVSSVQFFSGSTLLGTDITAPFSFIWTNVAAGTYTISARAMDNSGAVTTSTSINITVTVPVNIPPTVNITSPVNNASFTAPTNIIINASASDVDGTVTSVQFYNGTTLLGSVATAPYTFTWSTVAAGTYVLTAKATDNSGAVTTSATVSITVAIAQVGDITGPTCGTKNGNGSFALAAVDKVNATNYNWWYTGSIQSIVPVPGDPTKITINFGNTFSAGNVCVGVNYSVSPWFKQYCKPLTICASGRTDDANGNSNLTAQLIIAPNPTQSDFTITVPTDVLSYSVINNLGIVETLGTSLNAGQTIQLGDQYPSGIYVLYIQYSDGSTDSKKIQKIK